MNKNKSDLIKMINTLREENESLKALQALYLKQSERIEKLERQFYLNQQYQGRNTIEVTGIPETVAQNQLENEIVKIYAAAQVVVDGDALERKDIQACHRIGKKNVTICKFVNRKFANEGLYNGKNLKGKDLYGNKSQIYINNSFCDEFRHINCLIRKAKKNNNIFRWKVKHGVNFIKVNEDDEEFLEVSHINDLVNLNIVEEEQYN